MYLAIGRMSFTRPSTALGDWRPGNEANVSHAFLLNFGVVSVHWEQLQYFTNDVGSRVVIQVSWVFEPVERITCYYGNQGDCGKKIELHPSTLVPRLCPASVACSTEKILDTRCVFLSLLAVWYNQLHLCYHIQKSSATSCISVITSRCPVQPAASLLSLPDVQCNQLHLSYHFHE